MRLIDVQASQSGPLHTIVQVDKAEIERQGKHVRYAILSHRWQQEEVTYEDLKVEGWQLKAGAQKLLAAIALARSEHHSYLWLDTCCINKDSSAELAEAINSMYQWYKEAQVCYAYLWDVQHAFSLHASEWFSRGWTLQELLAPREVEFLSSQWSQVGTRSSLAKSIHLATTIPVELLSGLANLEDYSVATRMSWAAHRRTERLEDTAYCLMGLFSVNMPLLYGEGSKAFIRLQEEIIRNSEDYTIFAWRKEDPSSLPTRLRPRNTEHGLLADDPSDFKLSAGVKQYRDWRDTTPFGITNKGLHLHLGISEQNDQILATLPCAAAGQHAGFLAISITRIPGPAHRYARVDCHRLVQTMAEGNVIELYFPQKRTMHASRSIFHSLSLDWRISGRPLFYPAALMIHKVALEQQAAQDSGSADVIGPIHISRMEPGLGAAILFVTSFMLVERAFVLLIGTCDDGQIGYEVKLCTDQERSDVEDQLLQPCCVTGINDMWTTDARRTSGSWYDHNWAIDFEPTAASPMVTLPRQQSHLSVGDVDVSIAVGSLLPQGDSEHVGHAINISAEHEVYRERPRRARMRRDRGWQSYGSLQ